MPQTVLPGGEVVGKVQCMGEVHTVLLSPKGKIALPAHDKEETAAEMALEVLGGSGCGCIKALLAWRFLIPEGRFGLRELWRRADKGRLPDPSRRIGRGLWGKNMITMLDLVPLGFERALRKAWATRQPRPLSIDAEDDIIDAEFEEESTPAEKRRVWMQDRARKLIRCALRKDGANYFGCCRVGVNVDASGHRGRTPHVHGRVKKYTYMAYRYVLARTKSGKIMRRRHGRFPGTRFHKRVPVGKRTEHYRRMDICVDAVSYMWMRAQLGRTGVAVDGPRRVLLLKLTKALDGRKATPGLPAPRRSRRGGSDSERLAAQRGREQPGDRPRRWVAYAARQYGVWCDKGTKVRAARCIIRRGQGYQWVVERWLSPGERPPRAVSELPAPRRSRRRKATPGLPAPRRSRQKGQ